VVTLAHLRRLLAFVLALPAADAFDLDAATLRRCRGWALLARTALPRLDDAVARRAFLDRAGAARRWRAAPTAAPRAACRRCAAQGLLTGLASRPAAAGGRHAARCRRDDGLFHSYNLVDLSPGRADVGRLYPMLEGQVAMLSCGLLARPRPWACSTPCSPANAVHAARRSFLLYPDRRLPGFLERNRLDDAALALPVVQRLLAEGRTDLLQRQSDGTVRFAPGLSNRADLEAAGRDLGDALQPLAEAYERLLRHHEFTGRSGTMFAYEGLGCIYWHMVAKLLLAVQEQVFEAADARRPRTAGAWQAHYRACATAWATARRRRVRRLPRRPLQPHAGEGGAQQPGMTGPGQGRDPHALGRAGPAHPVLLDAGPHPRSDPVLLDPHVTRFRSATRSRSAWACWPTRCSRPRWASSWSCWCRTWASRPGCGASCSSCRACSIRSPTRSWVSSPTTPARAGAGARTTCSSAPS
jgi:hypothetical protein